MKTYQVHLENEKKMKTLWVEAECAEKALIFASADCNSELSFTKTFYPNLVDKETGEIGQIDWDRVLNERDIDLKSLAEQYSRDNEWELHTVREVADSEVCIGFQVHEIFYLKNAKQAEEFQKALMELEERFCADTMGSENFWAAKGNCSYDGEYNENDVPSNW